MKTEGNHDNSESGTIDTLMSSDNNTEEKRVKR